MFRLSEYRFLTIALFLLAILLNRQAYAEETRIAPEQNSDAKSIETPEQVSEISFRQKILMPGPLVSGHAEFEAQCEVCHASFEKEKMEGLCLDCHEELREDRASQSGFHGSEGSAATESCENCHKEHEGRDTDLTGFTEDTFDHNFTRFPLEGVHQATACLNCHDANEKFRAAPNQCVDCHKEDDIHQGNAGVECGTCHQAQSWRKKKIFDHSNTDFALLGKHEEVGCNSCHLAQQFEFESHGCIDCHRSKDIHGGANGTECETCHSEEGWDRVVFDHDETDFPLKGEHQTVPCFACHKNGEESKAAPTNCHGCHANRDVHFGRNGETCESCHVETSWRESIFDHDTDTDYELTGKHQNVQCTQCHIGALTEQLPRDCAGCHKADDIHKIEEMQTCGLCHNTESWQSTTRFDHDFTSMPLIGMHRIVPCQTCHIGNQFASTNTDCHSCHKFDDVHKDALGRDCAQCHTPNAWNPWQFDHNDQTDYSLEGKHENLSCDACHRPGTKPDATSQICGDCHQGQDIHDGGYGNQCGRCHNTSSFHELFLP